MLQKNVELKIGKNTKAGQVATAIVELVKEGKKVELQAFGAGAVNQATMAISLANERLKLSGKTILYTPAFKIIENDLTCLSLKIINGEPVSKTKAWLHYSKKWLKHHLNKTLLKIKKKGLC